MLKRSWELALEAISSVLIWFDVLVIGVHYSIFIIRSSYIEKCRIISK